MGYCMDIAMPIDYRKSECKDFVCTCANALMENKTKTRKKKEKKKKKNNFVKREGDWICYKCKNLNFAFRNVCNKCKLPKEESEKLLFDIGNELMKLADLSIGNKRK
jgi:hypothetical protein